MTLLPERIRESLRRRIECVRLKDGRIKVFVDVGDALESVAVLDVKSKEEAVEIVSAAVISFLEDPRVRNLLKSLREGDSWKTRAGGHYRKYVVEEVNRAMGRCDGDSLESFARRSLAIAFERWVISKKRGTKNEWGWYDDFSRMLF